MIIIGLGTGRSGTASLAKLLNAQADAVCFHEMNPSAMRWNGTPRPAVNMVEEFDAILEGGATSRLTVDLSRRVAAEAYDQLRAMPRAKLLGDIAFYHLNYVDEMATASDKVRFLCLKRDKDETVDSWSRKTQVPRWRSKRIADRIGSAITREPYHSERNPWMEHDGTQWAVDEVWDKCFPNMPGPTRAEAISQYYDMYYETAEKIQERHKDIFRIVETEALNTPEMQTEILTFLGIAPENQVFTDAHIHSYKKGAAGG